MTELVVGCPLRDRLWIIPWWFEYVASSVKAAGLDAPMVIFVGDPLDSSVKHAVHEANDRGWDHVIVPVEEKDEGYIRTWNHTRYREMAELRNRLLTAVRQWEPKYFWSLDSDILPAENALLSAIEALSRFDAVGQRCYMTEIGTWCPSYSNFTGGGGLLRQDAEGCFRVDVIMASKVMSPRAYAVSYEPHDQGEDIGWSKACRQSGVKLGWDGRTVSKHVMSRESLHPIDVRCGY